MDAMIQLRPTATSLVHQPRPVYYRVHEQLYTESRLMLVETTFVVLRYTPKGAWIDEYGTPRFILTSARKRYACPTKEEALASYHARKRRQVEILRHQLKRAEAALTLQPDNATVYF